MIFLSKHISLYALNRLKWILDIIWPSNQHFNQKNQRNGKNQVWMLNFLSGMINCILLHWRKKLALVSILEFGQWFRNRKLRGLKPWEKKSFKKSFSFSKKQVWKTQWIEKKSEVTQGFLYFCEFHLSTWCFTVFFFSVCWFQKINYIPSKDKIY